MAERYLGSKHAIAITLKNSLAAAKKIASSTQNKSGRAGKLSGAPSVATTNKSGKKTGIIVCSVVHKYLLNSLWLYLNSPLHTSFLEAASSTPGKTTADNRAPGDRNVDSLADAIAVDLGIAENK